MSQTCQGCTFTDNAENFPEYSINMKALWGSQYGLFTGVFRVKNKELLFERDV